MNTFFKATELYALKMGCYVLAGVAQWIEHSTAKQRVASLIPSQGACLGCGQVPSRGRVRGNHTVMFLSLPPFPSKNK